MSRAYYAQLKIKRFILKNKTLWAENFLNFYLTLYKTHNNMTLYKTQ